MKYNYIIIFCVLMFSNSYAQNYTPFDTVSFEKRKQLLEEYTTRHNQKIKDIKRTYSGSTSRDMQEAYNNQFYNFSRVINKKELYFDATIQNYAQKILQEIVNSNPSLANKNIAVYFSRSTEPNAYSIGDGTVIINLELLRYLNDEAEIGFVLSHEIAHYILNHRDLSIQKSIALQNSEENKKAEKDIKKSKFNKQIKSDALVKDRLYERKNNSRYQEFQADSLGLVFFKNTKYNPASSIKLLEHLSKTDIEKDSLSRKSYVKNFTTKNQPFLKEWTVMEDFSGYNYSKESIFKWNIDSLKTHPNCEQRIAKISPKVASKKKDFYTDKAFFDELKKGMKINSYIPSINPTEQTKSQQYYFGFMTNMTLSELEKLASDYKN
jgi:hypothetical protein